MKVIFLDIDGVLNSEEFFIKNKDSKFSTDIDKEKVLILKKAVEETGAEIVISSSWRGAIAHCINNNGKSEIEDIKYLLDLFKENNMHIYSITPYVSKGRGTEIRRWINECREPIESFVILDDEIFRDFYFLKDNVVKTEFYGKNGGLQTKHIKLIKKILNREEVNK